jgi:NAD(P)-dependent dehydrogenase (short-subunit alcohol dehydrogenase family)
VTPARTGPKTYVITGGSDGIGLECASQLGRAEPGCRVIVIGRDPRRTAAAVGRLRAESPQCASDSLLCDFADQGAVRRLADDLLRTCQRIDVLVNNAGTVFPRRTLTADGVEATFAVNHLAGFLLTELLLDRLRESAPARIVFTSSAGHYSGSLDLDDVGFERGYSIMRAYSRSKLANVLVARHLARRLAGSGVTVTSLHPGAISTNIWSRAPWFARPVLALAKLRMESPEVGGARLAYLAASPEVEGASGGYYDRNRLRDPSRLAQDDALGERLYDVSSRLVGLAGTTA